MQREPQFFGSHVYVLFAVQRNQNMSSLFAQAFSQCLSPGQTIEQSWIPHATLLDVNVEVVAKEYPKLLDETFKFKLTLNL